MQIVSAILSGNGGGFELGKLGEICRGRTACHGCFDRHRFYGSRHVDESRKGARGPKVTIKMKSLCERSSIRDDSPPRQGKVHKMIKGKQGGVTQRQSSIYSMARAEGACQLLGCRPPSCAFGKQKLQVRR